MIIQIVLIKCGYCHYLIWIYFHNQLVMNLHSILNRKKKHVYISSVFWSDKIHFWSGNLQGILKNMLWNRKGTLQGNIFLLNT